MSINFHRLVRPIDINRLIFIDYYRLYRLISDDQLSSIGHARIDTFKTEHGLPHSVTYFLLALPSKASSNLSSCSKHWALLSLTLR